MDKKRAWFVPKYTASKYNVTLLLEDPGSGRDCRVFLEAGPGYRGGGREDEFLFLMGEMEEEIFPVEVDRVWIQKMVGTPKEFRFVKSSDRCGMNFQEAMNFVDSRRMFMT